MIKKIKAKSNNGGYIMFNPGKGREKKMSKLDKALKKYPNDPFLVAYKKDVNRPTFWDSIDGTKTK